MKSSGSYDLHLRGPGCSECGDQGGRMAVTQARHDGDRGQGGDAEEEDRGWTGGRE